MKITYIGHSGFLVEWETCCWLFDYYKGEIPEMDPEKKIFVFASHSHHDHFNPEIFKLADRYPDVEYVLSSDIRTTERECRKLGIADGILEKTVSVKPTMEYELQDKDGSGIALETLRSTDAGVAFLLRYQGKTIYHAGDLNLWVWRGETKQYNNHMTAMFDQEMEHLKDVQIDVAFVPLDPRQEDWYYMGLEKLMETARIRYVFPMHFWENPAIIQKFKQERMVKDNDTAVVDIFRDGQDWEIEV